MDRPCERADGERSEAGGPYRCVGRREGGGCSPGAESTDSSLQCTRFTASLTTQAERNASVMSSTAISDADVDAVNKRKSLSIQSLSLCIITAHPRTRLT